MIFILFRKLCGHILATWMRIASITNHNNPANTKRWPDVGLLLAHRLCRWTNIKTTLIKRLVFAGNNVHLLSADHDCNLFSGVLTY